MIFYIGEHILKKLLFLKVILKYNLDIVSPIKNINNKNIISYTIFSNVKLFRYLKTSSDVK